MMNLEDSKESLNQTGLEMFEICKNQLLKSREAFSKHDSDLAEEVMHTENRVNALDLKIDRDCEKIIALHNPVASDLRFVMALRKINFDLERIGDHAYGISKYVVDVDTKIEQQLLDNLRFDEMYDHTLSMFEDITVAYTESNTKKARKVFKKEKKLNEINQESFKKIEMEIKKNVEKVRACLLLFSVIKKVERIGDLITNIAEEIIFYRDAEILKHNKKK